MTYVMCVPQDADVDLAAKNVIKGGYSYSGQRCTAVKGVLALESIADELVGKVRSCGRVLKGITCIGD